MGKVVLHKAPGGLKSTSAMTAAWKHNMRLDHCKNADSSMSHLNRVLVDRGMTYAQYYKELMKTDYVPQKHFKTGTPIAIKSNAVKMLDLRISVNAKEIEKNPHFDLDEFLRRSKEFVEERFGEKNIAGMVFHADEIHDSKWIAPAKGNPSSAEYSPHIHIMIIPLTSDGRLDSHYFITPQKLSEMQTELAEKMSDLGLERGRRRSVVDSRTIKEYYGDIKDARTSSLPDPEPGENIHDFKRRCDAELMKIKSQHMDEREKLQAEIRSLKTDVRQTDRARIADLENENVLLKKENEELKEDLSESRTAVVQWMDVVSAVQNHLLQEDDERTLGALLREASSLGREFREDEELNSKR